MVEVKKADLKEALVIKFDGINFGVMDLEKARALRDELIKYFGVPDVGSLSLDIKINGDGPATLQSVSYDPLSRQSEFVFTL